jgi:hypothetical protein
LLAFLTLVDKVNGKLRYRLVGTGAAQQLGRDLTGTLVGQYLSQPEVVTRLCAIYERVFSTARPLFATGEYQTRWGTSHHISQLMLPLSDDDKNVNMIMFARVARFNFKRPSGADWLRGTPVIIHEPVEVKGDEDIEQRCLDWERSCAITARPN